MTGRSVRVAAWILILASLTVLGFLAVEVITTATTTRAR